MQLVETAIALPKRMDFEVQSNANKVIAKLHYYIGGGCKTLYVHLSN